MTFWSIHTHSKFSAKDALPEVASIVATARELDYPALALTDHGNVAGSAQLYRECRKAGIKPLPGSEIYLAFNRTDYVGTQPKTFHAGIVAYTPEGYRNLVGLSTLTHRNYYYKPVIDFGDLADLAETGLLEGLAVTTGCWFGLVPTAVRERGDEVAKNILASLQVMFDEVYVEIQHHAVYEDDHDDDERALVMKRLADEMSMPIVLGQDSHYCHQSDRKIHDEMKSLVSWSDDPEDSLFPGDGYHMVDEEWMADHHIEPILQAGLAGLADLESKACVVIPELDNFVLKVPDLAFGTSSDNELRDRVIAALDEKVMSGEIKEADAVDHYERAASELKVVKNAGFADYLLFTALVTTYMKEEGIVYGVRGSASGSELCWLLDISQLDPIKEDLQFDRFLSNDRTKPPDIDLDIEHVRRKQVIEWLESKFTVSHIGTWSKLGLTEETGWDDPEDQQKGSLITKWKTRARKTGDDPFRRLTTFEYRLLQKLSDMEVFNGYGVHAAGILIIPDEAAGGAVPLQYVASSKTMVTGYDMNDIEAFGMVKLDLLGLRTITALADCWRMTGIDPWTLPRRDQRVYSRIGSGRTAGMFQLSGYTFSKGMREMKPKSMAELTAAMAIYRPAAIKSDAKDIYLARRSGQQKIPRAHEIIEQYTSDTFGVVVYQDQVINIIKAMGLAVDDIERARKAIKASQADEMEKAQKTMTEIMSSISSLGKGLGMRGSDIDFLENAIMAYAKYGFNKAHAASYAVLAWATAWFSVHHPVEFWTASLNSQRGAAKPKRGRPVAEIYLETAEHFNVKFLPPNVNDSKATYTIKETNGEKFVLTGLLAVDGVGEKCADEIVAHQPFESLVDLGARVNASRVTGAKHLRDGKSPVVAGGRIADLHHAGALMGIPKGVPVPVVKKTRAKKATQPEEKED